MNILVVDDEPDILELLTLCLENADYNVIGFSSSTEAIQNIDKYKIDLAIFDIMLPNINGFELCKIVREQYDFPIIFLSAKDSEMDKVHGLNIGADDYISKPFKKQELVARVRSNIRRYYGHNINNDNIIEFNSLYINNKSHIFKINDKEIKLTPIEFSIMWELCKNRGNVVENDCLFKNIWKEKYYESDNNTIMVHIRHIRSKINSVSREKYINTIWGVGYKINEK